MINPATINPCDRKKRGDFLSEEDCVKTHLKDMTLIRWRYCVIFSGAIWVICLRLCRKMTKAAIAITNYELRIVYCDRTFYSALST